MCTIYTFTYDDLVGSDKSEYNHKMWEDRISRDIAHNSHGFSILLVDEFGKAVGQSCGLSKTDTAPIMDYLWQNDYHRAFVHLRFATGQHRGLAQTHRWESNGVWYMHNGVLRASPAHLKVDSLQIGEWLKVDIDYTLARLAKNMYANVFLVDEEKDTYYVSRSSTGSLFTDGKGNFSTNQVGVCNVPVGRDVQLQCQLSDWSDWAAGYGGYVATDEPTSVKHTKLEGHTPPPKAVGDDEYRGLKRDKKHGFSRKTPASETTNVAKAGGAKTTKGSGNTPPPPPADTVKSWDTRAGTAKKGGGTQSGAGFSDSSSSTTGTGNGSGSTKKGKGKKSREEVPYSVWSVKLGRQIYPYSLEEYNRIMDENKRLRGEYGKVN